MIRSCDALVQHLERGGAISYEQRHEPEPKTIWVTERGEGVHAGAAKWAKATGKLKPLGDGLFPGDSQTFVSA